jgi:hypothetical protein
LARFYSIRENKIIARGIEGSAKMVERKSELKRRYHRKKKLTKLKHKLATAKDPRDKEAILRKIHIISPWWEVPAEA